MQIVLVLFAATDSSTSTPVQRDLLFVVIRALKP